MSDLSSIESTYAQLRVFHATTTARLALAPISSTTRSALTGSLRMIGGWIARLGPSGDLGIAVTHGTITTARWAGIAQANADGLRSVMESIGEENVFSRFWGEVVIPTATDVKQVVVDGAGGFGAGLGVVAGLVLVLFALKVFR